MRQFVNLYNQGILLGLFLISLPAFAEVSQETMIDVLQRLDQLEKKSRELHGENEVLKHELEKLKKIQKEGFLNVDERVDALAAQIKSASAEKAVTGTLAEHKSQDSDSGNPENKESNKTETTPEEGKAAPNTSIKDPSDNKLKDLESNTDNVDEKVDDKAAGKRKIRKPSKYEKETYQAAFEKMKKSPTAGTLAFQEYIELQPDSPLAANAQYWIGEIKYSHNNYKGAVQDFIKVLQKYKYSDKAPDAAIKLGYSFYALKNWVYARRTFEDVLKYFPENKNAVNLAKKRLAKLDAAGH